jgi:hypothetical protein
MAQEDFPCCHVDAMDHPSLVLFYLVTFTRLGIKPAKFLS